MNDRANPRRTVGAGAGLVSVSLVASAVLGAAVGIIVARVLGPEGTGAFNVIGSTLLLAGQIGTLGIGIALSYYVARGEWAAGEAFRQVQLAALAIGIVVGGIGLLLAVALPNGAFRGIPLEIFAIAMAALPFALSLNFLGQLALTVDRHMTYTVVVVGQMVVYLVGVAIFTPLVGLGGAVASGTLALLGAAVALELWGRRTLAPAEPGWLARTGSRLAHAMRFGLKSHASGVLQLVNQRMDIFILNATAAQATVGHYTIAVGVTAMGLLIPRSLSMVVLPRVASLEHASAGGEQRMVLEKSARHAVMFGLGTMVVLVVGVFLIPLVYGSTFAPSVTPGLILVPGIAALGVAVVLGGTTIAKGFPQYSLYTALIVTPPTLLAYALLIPRFQEIGAAIASTASYGANALVATYFFGRATNLPLVRSLMPTWDEVLDYRRLFSAAVDRMLRR